LYPLPIPLLLRTALFDHPKPNPLVSRHAMSSPQTISTPVRRFISILLMLLLLAVFLSLYFFKYVPEQKSDYNKRAFMELKSVTDAFSRRDAAYQQVFSWTPGSHSKQPDTIGLEVNEGNWKVVYRSSKSN
jgi:hypothetical protein